MNNTRERAIDLLAHHVRWKAEQSTDLNAEQRQEVESAVASLLFGLTDKQLLMLVKKSGYLLD